MRWRWDSRPPCLQNRAHRKHESRKETSENPLFSRSMHAKQSWFGGRKRENPGVVRFENFAGPVKREIDPARNPISRGCKTVMACWHIYIAINYTIGRLTPFARLYPRENFPPHAILISGDKEKVKLDSPRPRTRTCFVLRHVASFFAVVVVSTYFFIFFFFIVNLVYHDSIAFAA